MVIERYRTRNLGSVLTLEYGHESRLYPGQRILDPSLVIGLVSNNRLLASKLQLKFRDFNPIQLGDVDGNLIYQLKYPGKSAMLIFDDEIDRNGVGKLVNTSLKRVANRRDRLHVSTVGQIDSVGWQVFWAPLPGEGNVLHTRIVPLSVVNGYEFSNEEADALKSVFVKAA